MDAIISQIETLYETETIIKSCVICDSENTLREFVAKMKENDHTIECILEDDIDDERPLYVYKMHSFRDHARVVAMTYTSWHLLQECVEENVLPYQNLLIVMNLEDELVKYIARSVQDSMNRGFRMNGEIVPSHFVVLSSE